MPHPNLQRILQTVGIPNLVELLSDKLSPTDLQSLLLAVYQQQAQKVTPAQLKTQYQTNRFVKSSLIDPLQMLAFEQLAFSIATKVFQPIELAPLVPLGSCSAIASVNQNKIVSTSRNVEVIADPTNVMALECAQRRSAILKTKLNIHPTIRLCCSQRVTRAQFFDMPNAFAHFKLFALCSAGKDQGNFLFEKQELEQHLAFYLALLTHASFSQMTSIEILVTPIEARLESFIINDLFPKLSTHYPKVNFKLDKDRENGIGYYQTLCFTINGTNEKGEKIHLTDGGFTDWTQKLMSNRKERYLISAIGSERLVLIFMKPTLSK